MKVVYKFYLDCGRPGHLEGLFIADSEEVDNIIGREVYFGEVLGKHSEVYGIIDKEDITLITTDSDIIKVLEANNISSGYNPLDYYEESEEEE